MINQTPHDFRKTFLLAFTHELIKSSSPELFLDEQINKIQEEEKQEIKEIKQQEQKEKQIHEKKISDLVKKKISPRGKIIHFRQRKPMVFRNKIPRILTIPEPRLPADLQYLMPSPTNIRIDLGKLNPLIKDNAVKEIECDGPNKNVIVKIPNPRPSKVILSKGEITEIIDKFSEAAKIPVQEGLFRVALGPLTFSALITEGEDSKFIIRKIPPKQRPMQIFRPMGR